MARKINKAGVDLVKAFEGLSLKPYRCSADVPTIGYGSTFYEDGRKVSMQDSPITEERALQLLEYVLNDYASKLEVLFKVPVTDNQFAALCCFAYNVGPGALQSSTLLKKLNAKDYSATADEFERWNKAGGVVLPGLTRRRQAERALFLHSPAGATQENKSSLEIPSDEDILKSLKDVE